MSPDYSWTLSPGVLLAVTLVGVVYCRRWWRVRRAGDARGAPVIRLVSFLVGLALIVVALVSPVDALASQLFTMHMAQHVLLLDLGPIFCILGLTKVIMRPVTRRIHALEQRAGLLAAPIFAAILYAATMWIWHIPSLYDAALETDAIHVLEHATFTIAGTLYWWHLLSPIRSRYRLGGLGPLAYMATTKLSLGLLGILLTFSPVLIYTFYEHQPEYWGMSHVTDQNVGGVLMALEQSVVMGLAFALLFVRMLGESEQEERRRERFAPVAD